MIDQIEETVIAGLLGLMTLITFANVVARFVFNSNILWALELTVFLFAWLVLLGASYAVKKHAHLAYHPSIYPHLPELVYFGKARERPPDGAQACPEEGTQGSSSFPDPLFSPRCATGCSSFAPVETARYTAIAGTGMSRSRRSGFLIRLRVMPKPGVLKSGNIASMLRRIPWSGTLYSDGAAFMAMIHGSLWPSSWSTPMVEKTPVP